MSNSKFKYDPQRRTALKGIALGGMATIAGGVGSLITGCSPKKTSDRSAAAVGGGEMTYRINPATGDKVSILGYGCMRWPTLPDSDGVLDQETINELVDYALAHGVNYFDTSPAYCRGFSEQATGIALARHPRDSYFIATKLSNFAPQTWSREKSMEMYENSFRYLQTDYIDYLLLHAIGQGGMDNFNKRYMDNGMLDFLIEEREKGKIRNLGFSYHGDVEVFDTMLRWHDEGRVRWDFVQIQMNYVDWLHAKEINSRNTNGEYLYGELEKRG
ncbi:MAG: aldo/keto reductase, partial [Muribaculaceae bacterium]|nr:aldo/keto reductase [Muribaculaceae bacterium]